MEELFNQVAPSTPKGKPKTFKCPSCAGVITIKAVGITINAVCSSCSSIIDVTNENYQIIDQAKKKIRNTLFELGNRGRFDGIDWEVIGYMQKCDSTRMYRWDEYLLYNPYQGFRFLVQSNGHWNFVKVLRKDITGAGVTNNVYLDDRKFNVFLKDESIVEYVKGEFYWRVKVGETNFAADYIAPPQMLSVEKNDQEINISLAEYVTPKEVAEAFGVSSGTLPYRTGIAPNQPAPYQGKFLNIWLVAGLAIIAALMIQIVTENAADNEEVYAASAYVDPYQKDQTFSTELFNLPKDSNLQIKTYSPVDNNWAEFSYSLVNQETNEQYSISQAIERYQGYDGGEHWSEGSNNSRTVISKIPKGNYRMLIDTDAGVYQNHIPLSFEVHVNRDVPNSSNFWITLLLVLVYPIFASFRRWGFEAKRWAESDYAPAGYKTQ